MLKRGRGGGRVELQCVMLVAIYRNCAYQHWNRVTGSLPVPGPGSHLGDLVPMLAHNTCLCCCRDVLLCLLNTRTFYIKVYGNRGVSTQSIKTSDVVSLLYWRSGRTDGIHRCYFKCRQRSQCTYGWLGKSTHPDRNYTLLLIIRAQFK